MSLKKWVGAVAIVIGLLSIAPYLIGYFFIPDTIEINQSEKLHYFYQDSELIYLGRIREVIEGEWGIASLAFLEYKNAPIIQQPFGEWLYAGLAFMQREWLPTVAVLTKAVFPALLFILVFYFVRFLLRAESTNTLLITIISVVLAWLIASGLDVYRPHHIFSALMSGGGGEPILSIWTRLVNPITGMLALIAIMFLTLKAKGPFSFKRSIGWGLIVGLASGYIFSFGLILGFCGLLFVIWCIYKEWNRVKEGLLALFVATLCNYTFVLGVFNKLSSDGESLGKNGLFETTVPLINNVLVIGILVFLLTLAYFLVIEKSRLKDLFLRPWWRFCLVALSASFVGYNQQFVSGKTVWPQHFIQYTDPLVLIVVIGGVFLVFEAYTKRLSFWKPVFTSRLVTAGSALLICLTLVAQLATFPTVMALADKYSDSQRYVAILDWLNEESQSDSCVVLALESQERFERYVFAYTDCDLYHSSYIYMSIPEERIMHNYLTELRLFGVTSDNIDSHLENNFYRWQHLFFRDWYDKFSEKPDPWLQSIAKPNQRQDFYDTTKAMIKEEYLKSLETPVVDWLLKYQLDYIVVDHKHDQLELDTNLFEPLISNNQITVYQVVVQ